MANVTQPEPRVSIGMPVYNGERFLRQAVDSILAQTFTDFELIISDNASTDATSEICRGYATRDARVRYIAHAVNRGAAWNSNYVLALARAEYFKWAHADDLHAPCYLECCLAELDRAPPSVVAVCSRGVIIDEHDQPVSVRQNSMDLRQPHPSDRLRWAVRNAVWCNVLFGLIRTHVVRACRPHGVYPAADLALIHELALRGQIWEIPDPLFYRRWHPPWAVMDTAIWLDPRNKRSLIPPHGQVLLNTLRAIGAADLPWVEAFRCRVALLREWLPPRWREWRNDFKCAVRTWLRLRIDRRWGEGRAQEFKNALDAWWRRFRNTPGTAASTRTPER